MAADQGPNMELRALVAVALSLLVLVVSQWVLAPPPPAVPELPPVRTPESPAVGAPGGADQGSGMPGAGVELSTGAGVPPGTGAMEEPGAEDEAGSRDAPGATGDVAAEPIGADSEEQVVVLTDRYVVTLTNRGARIRSMILEGYRSDLGGPLELVVDAFGRRDQLPLALTSADAPEAAVPANQGLYRMQVEGGRVARDSEGRRAVRSASPGEPIRVRMRWSDGNGWDVEKTVGFSGDSYLVEFGVRARSPQAVPLSVTLGPGLVQGIDSSTRSFYLTQGGVYFRGDDVEHRPAGDLLEEPEVLEGGFVWGGIESNYFAMLFVPAGAARARLSGEAWPGVEEGTVQGDAAAEVARGPVARFAMAIPPGGLDVPLYVGPKQYDLLAAHGHELQRAVDFGFFGFLAYPLLVSLKWVEGFVGNWGIAIIALTVLIRVLFLPLTHTSMKSMRKMQKLQPEMQAIRARYKGVKDLEKRQQMNAEVMELYKKHGVSPLGGCLPMLLQMPVLFAFYALLSVAIELRQAPFFLWVQDLSKYDPYLVLPILMGASMYAQQRMSPTTADPMQARIFRLMPVMFTVFFLYLPSGLVLYWLTNNILGIGQQYLVNRQMDASEPESVATRGQGGKGKKGKRGKRSKRGK